MPGTHHGSERQRLPAISRAKVHHNLTLGRLCREGYDLAPSILHFKQACLRIEETLIRAGARCGKLRKERYRMVK